MINRNRRVALLVGGHLAALSAMVPVALAKEPEPAPQIPETKYDSRQQRRAAERRARKMAKAAKRR